MKKKKPVSSKKTISSDNKTWSLWILVALIEIYLSFILDTENIDNDSNNDNLSESKNEDQSEPDIEEIEDELSTEEINGMPLKQMVFKFHSR